MPETTTSSTIHEVNEDDVNSVHHPLYLHKSDHPGLILISKKLNGTENYNSWKRSMVIALNARNKLKIVNGEYPEPKTSSNLRAHWERTNDLVISWILNTLSEHVSNSLNFIHYASALWKELHEHYAQLDGHRVYQLANDISQLKQSNCNVEIYYHKLKGLWDESDSLEIPYTCTCPCTCEVGKNSEERDNRKRLMQFLMGLDDCYANDRGQILLMQPLPQVTKAYSMIRQEEKQRESTTAKLNVPTAFSFNNNRFQQPQFRPSSNGSQVRETGTFLERRSTFKKGVICSYCHKEGHTKEECYRNVGYLVNHPMYNKSFTPRPQTKSPYPNPRTINAVQTQDQSEPSMQNDPATQGAMFAKMDQLQNQIIQMMSMMQYNSKDPTGAIPLINTHMAGPAQEDSPWHSL